jgi:hypothetical protein
MSSKKNNMTKTIQISTAALKKAQEIAAASKKASAEAVKAAKAAAEAEELASAAVKTAEDAVAEAKKQKRNNERLEYVLNLSKKAPSIIFVNMNEDKIDGDGREYKNKWSANQEGCEENQKRLEWYGQRMSGGDKYTVEGTVVFMRDKKNKDKSFQAVGVVVSKIVMRPNENGEGVLYNLVLKMFKYPQLIKKAESYPHATVLRTLGWLGPQQSFGWVKGIYAHDNYQKK